MTNKSEIRSIYSINLKSDLFIVKRYGIMGTVQKLNRKVVDRDKLDTPNKPIHDRLRSWLDAGTIKH
jgi:hypothetical protein